MEFGGGRDSHAHCGIDSNLCWIAIYDDLQPRGSRSTDPSGVLCGGDSAVTYSVSAAGFDAISSVNRLSLRNAANSESLYTFLKSLYPSSIAFLRYCSERSEKPIFAYSFATV